ncbi:excinuclease ABC subunit UvrA [Candidatus Berkelbacteria bacterium]|nr:excinuclease ABC subunit UvrA [Candidatus Berkelbacteria bacterium]
MPTHKSHIRVEGARVHNLKNVSVKIPRNKITVVTGLSGSGKSSLAFDTIYAEGQRRYVDSLSSYARQFFGTLQKPDVDLIEGLAPSISIDQKSAAQSPRSTVGTMSEIYDYLRLLYTRLGVPHCPICHATLSEAEATTAKPRSASQQRRRQKFLSCPEGHGPYEEPTLGSFSFNSPQGACELCHGLGTRKVVDASLLLPNPRLTLAEGAIRPLSRLGNQGQAVQKLLEQYVAAGGRIDVPVGGLTEAERSLLVEGDPGQRYEGVTAYLERRHDSTDSSYVRSEIERYMVEQTCHICQGKRLKASSLAVLVDGRSITDLTSMTVAEAQTFFRSVGARLTGHGAIIAAPILRDVSGRLSYLIRVGLEYLTLDRSADTLAGGEAQRIRLATQLGSGLTGVLYVLDEPSVGLHPRDLDRLIETIVELRDLENTVIVVEHDAQMIQAADYLIDVGPGAGVDGGRIVAQGTPAEVQTSPRSLTAQYLRGDRVIALPQERRSGRQALTIHDAHDRNLQHLTVRIPLETLTCITGVSGSGKSTLVRNILAKALAKHFYRAKSAPGAFQRITGVEYIDKVINVDQSPIGRTPRSNPATYTNVFGLIRDLFAATDLAMTRTYDAGHFSFNVKGGRCEVCRGDGVLRHEMHFLPDVTVTCETCNGTRYKDEILEVTYRGKTIADVLAMSIGQAHAFFKDQPGIAGKLEVLVAVGLGYLEMGQPATTLSGGEAQRVKLATELARQSTGRTFYILDEPTTGLHFEDIRHLLEVLQALVAKGNTVLVIEHNLDVIKSADWIVDLGPEGGEGGGRIVAEGTPEQVAREPESLTGQYLQPLLASARPRAKVQASTPRQLTPTH